MQVPQLYLYQSFLPSPHQEIEYSECIRIYDSSHSPYELWGIMDACAEDLSTSVTDALLEGYEYWGGMAHLEKAANGLPLWPTNAEFCGRVEGPHSLRLVAIL